MGAVDTEVIAIGVGVAPVIALLINPLKRYVPTDLMLYVAIAAGLAWTVLFHWTQDALSKETIMATIMLGITTGMAATGSYDALSTVTKRSETAAKMAVALTILPIKDGEE